MAATLPGLPAELLAKIATYDGVPWLLAQTCSRLRAILLPHILASGVLVFSSKNVGHVERFKTAFVGSPDLSHFRSVKITQHSSPHTASVGPDILASVVDAIRELGPYLTDLDLAIDGFLTPSSVSAMREILGAVGVEGTLLRFSLALGMCGSKETTMELAQLVASKIETQRSLKTLGIRMDGDYEFDVETSARLVRGFRGCVRTLQTLKWSVQAMHEWSLADFLKKARSLRQLLLMQHDGFEDDGRADPRCEFERVMEAVCVRGRRGDPEERMKLERLVLMGWELGDGFGTEDYGQDNSSYGRPVGPVTLKLCEALEVRSTPFLKHLVLGGGFSLDTDGFVALAGALSKRERSLESISLYVICGEPVEDVSGHVGRILERHELLRRVELKGPLFDDGCLEAVGRAVGRSEWIEELSVVYATRTGPVGFVGMVRGFEGSERVRRGLRRLVLDGNMLGAEGWRVVRGFVGEAMGLRVVSVKNAMLGSMVNYHEAVREREQREIERTIVELEERKRRDRTNFQILWGE